MNAAKEVKKELAEAPETECCKAAFLSGVIHTAGVISITREGMRVIIDSSNPFLLRAVGGIVGELFAFGEGEKSGEIKLDERSLPDGKKSGRGNLNEGSLPDGKESGRGNLDEGSRPDGEKTDGEESGRGNLNEGSLADGKKTDGEKIISGGFVQDMLLELRIFKLRDGFKVVEGIDPYLIESDCCKRAYLAGVFSGGGAFFAAKGYHLEFACASKKLRDDIIRLLADFEIRAAGLNRGGKFVAYIKDKEMISDCLALMGAPKSVLRLNSLMAQRSLSQEVSRAANCDMANLSRLVAASLNQREAIKKLGFIDDKKLRETAETRLNHPDLSYGELAEILGISKGALKYRLERLVAMAEEIE